MASRAATVASGIGAAILALGYLALTWDAWLANFQVRWMCDEDRPFILLRRTGVTVIGLQEETPETDTRALAVFGEAYPEVVVAGGQAAGRARYELVQQWPKVVREYWGFRVLRTDFAVVDRGDRDRVLGVAGLFRRDARRSGKLRAVRAALAPPARKCSPSDRIEFVKAVLRPPDPP